MGIKRPKTAQNRQNRATAPNPADSQEQFKPPWNFFPVHAVYIDIFTVRFEVGLDQGDLITYTVGFYENGELVIACGGSPQWRESLPNYLEMIDHARWLAHIEESGEPRYKRLHREHQEWEQQYRENWAKR